MTEDVNITDQTVVPCQFRLATCDSYHARLSLVSMAVDVLFAQTFMSYEYGLCMCLYARGFRNLDTYNLRWRSTCTSTM
jgi:hypothetical protein